MIKTAKQLKDLIRNLSKAKAADAQLLMRNYMMERFLERIQQHGLFVGLEIRQLYGRVKGNFSVIHHVQQFGNEFRETDEALDLVATIGRGFSDYINCTFSDRIVTKLVTIFLGWPPGLPFQGFQLHPISKSPLAGEQAFTLYVAVNHDDCRRIVVKVAHDDGHRR